MKNVTSYGLPPPSCSQDSTLRAVRASATPSLTPETTPVLPLKQHLWALGASGFGRSKKRRLGLLLLALSLPLPREAVGGGAFKRSANRGEGLLPCDSECPENFSVTVNP